MKTRTWICVFATVVLVCTAAWFLLPRPGGTVATIYQDGKPIKTVDLANLKQTETLTITGAAGENVIECSPAGIRVLSADCPDQTCVAHGLLLQGGTPIICLPNHLVICWAEKADAPYDAMTGS